MKFLFLFFVIFIDFFCSTRAESNFDKSSILKKSSSFKFVKRLNNCTQGVTIFSDKEGNKYVVKSSKNQRHTKMENLFDALFRKLGVSAPGSVFFNKSELPNNISKMVNNKFVRISKFINGFPNQKSYRKITKRQIRKHFAAIAFLGNRDIRVANLILDYSSNVHIIDNGSNFCYLPNGKRRKIKSNVIEIDHMRYKSKDLVWNMRRNNTKKWKKIKNTNAGRRWRAWNFFARLKRSAIKKQVRLLLKNSKGIISIVNQYSRMLGLKKMGKFKNTLRKRLSFLKRKYKV